MTAQLLCPVQNFIAITSLQLGWEPNEISIKFELLWNNRLWTLDPVLLPIATKLATRQRKVIEFNEDYIAGENLLSFLK